MKRIETILICCELFGFCVLLLCVIGAAKLFPEGNSDNALISFLLNHVTIQTAEENDRWLNEYPLDENVIERYVRTVNKAKSKLENYCTTSFPGNGTINTLVTEYKDKILQYHISGIPSIADNNVYISDSLENVIEFEKELNSLEIPFFYVQTPCKAGINYYRDAELAGDALNIAERSFCLTSSLEDNGIDVVNIARDNSDNISFDSTEHWKPSDGLYCAKIIAQKLYDNYKFEIDLSVFEANKFFDLLSENPEMKKRIESNCGYEYSVPTPLYSTDYQLTHAKNMTWSGDFKKVMFREEDEWNPNGEAYHNIFRISNSLIYEIKNNDALCDKKILIIGDSFNWPVGSYLSLGVSDITIIHNASFTGSMISYVKDMKPDIVIMVYNDAEFYEVYTEEAYYLK